jgi:hypothetical protein
VSVVHYKHKTLQAKILGRVERLTGKPITSNPFPRMSDQWLAFQEGWFREPDDSLIREICSRRRSVLKQPGE